jgi:hypothetical protein
VCKTIGRLLPPVNGWFDQVVVFVVTIISSFTSVPVAAIATG